MNLGSFIFFLWMLIPDKTVISKIGFVDFSKFFNFSSPEPNGAALVRCISVWATVAQRLRGLTLPRVCR